MAGQRPDGRGGWAYVSLVTVLPGLSINPFVALGAQFVVFEGAAIVLAATYGLWQALPLATGAITITTLGSALMVSLSDRIHSLEPPDPYRRLLFDSSVDVVMGLVAFIALVTYLLVDAGGGMGLFERLLGVSLPAPVAYFTLLVAWDLSYRIGIGWWASVTGLWRAIAFGKRFDETAAAGYVRTDVLTMAFAGLQLGLVPFLWADQFLVIVVLGHVGAVFAVSGLAIGIQLRRRGGRASHEETMG